MLKKSTIFLIFGKGNKSKKSESNFFLFLSGEKQKNPKIRKTENIIPRFEFFFEKKTRFFSPPVFERKNQKKIKKKEEVNQKNQKKIKKKIKKKIA